MQTQRRECNLLYELSDIDETLAQDKIDDIEVEGKDYLRKLYIAYYNSLKLLLGVPKRSETSPLCANLNIKSCPAVIRNLIFKFMTRLKTSDNDIIYAIYSSSYSYKLPMWKHWRKLLYVNN